MSSPKLFLWDHPMSSYAQKVRMALRLKGIDFDKETPENLGAGFPNAAFSAANPRMEVPALIDGDFKVFDSTTICLYLEEAYPEKSLFPKSPRDRAETRMIDDVVSTQYEAINWAFGEIKWFEKATGDEAERLLKAVAEQAGQLQEWLAERLGSKPFFNGDEVGYADIAVAPIINRSVANGYGPKEGSALQRWNARVNEIPAVKQTVEEMLGAVKQMSAAGPALFAKGSGRRREYRDHRLEFMIKNGAIGIVEQGFKDDTIRFSWPHPKQGAVSGSFVPQL